MIIMMMIGSWLWMSGAPWGFANWNEGEPNQNGNEDCGAFDSQAPDNSYKVGILIWIMAFSHIIYFDMELTSRTTECQNLEVGKVGMI